MTSGARGLEVRSAVERLAKDPDGRARLYARSLRVVVVSQVFGGAGLSAGVAVGGLLAQELFGSTGVAGVPVGLLTLGSAVAAYLVGRLSQSSGRRTGLATGFLAGALGAVGIVVAAVVQNPVLFFTSLVVYGAGNATNLQARYAGSDLALPRQRGNAVSTALVSTTLGAVAGPNLVGPTGEVARALGAPTLTGPFMLGALAYGSAGLVLWIFLRPDPYLVAAALAEAAPAESRPGDLAVPEQATGRRPVGVVLGASVMVVTQVAMVAIMTMTPVHMRDHGHSLTEVGFVIGVHVGAMYLPSLVTGPLVDQVGRVPMVVAAGLTLLAAGVVAGFAPTGSLLAFVVGLALLGLGWNFGLISGTALIVDSTAPLTRARTQGAVDVLVGLAGAAGGTLSGLVVAGAGFTVLSLLGAVLALALLPLLAWTGPRLPRSAVVS